MKKIAVIVNGKKKAIDLGKTIHDILLEYKFYPESVIVSLNDTMVDKNDYGVKTLKKNDSIEIVRFMSGG